MPVRSPGSPVALLTAYVVHTIRVMPGVADVLMVAIPAALTGGVGVYGGRQSRKLELDKLKELHRQKVEDRDHAERREAEAERTAGVARDLAVAQRVLLAADATPPYSNVPTKADRDAWTEFHSALAVIELGHDAELTAAARKLGVGRWNRDEYAAARVAYIEVLQSKWPAP